MSAVWTGRFHSGLLAGAASADGATAGRFWILNHVGSNLLLVVKKIVFISPVPIAAATAATRVTAERMTFTGAPSGAQGTPSADDSLYAIPGSGVSVRTASTGITPAAGAIICAGVCGVNVSAAGVAAGAPVVPLYDGSINFRPGEGLVCRQADNGDTDQQFAMEVQYQIFNTAQA